MNNVLHPISARTNWENELLKRIREKYEQFPYEISLSNTIDMHWLNTNIGLQDVDWHYDSLSSMINGHAVYRFRTVEHHVLIKLTWC